MAPLSAALVQPCFVMSLPSHLPIHMESRVSVPLARRPFAVLCLVANHAADSSLQTPGCGWVAAETTHGGRWLPSPRPLTSPIDCCLRAWGSYGPRPPQIGVYLEGGGGGRAETIQASRSPCQGLPAAEISLGAACAWPPRSSSPGPNGVGLSWLPRRSASGQLSWVGPGGSRPGWAVALQLGAGSLPSLGLSLSEGRVYTSPAVLCSR